MVGLDVMVAPLICTLHNTHSGAHGTFTMHYSFQNDMCIHREVMTKNCVKAVKMQFKIYKYFLLFV